MSNDNHKKRKASPPTNMDNNGKQPAVAPSTTDGITFRSTDSAQTIANKLLRLLPPSNDSSNTANMADYSKQVKKLNHAVRLFQSEMQHRAQVLSQTATQVGSEKPIIAMSGDGSTSIQIPGDVFGHVLDFLTQNEKGVTVPLVCRAWLSESRLPWKSLHLVHNYAYYNFNMTNLLALFRNQPHLQQINHLTVPKYIKFGKAGIRKLAQLCPVLTSLDLSHLYALPDKTLLLDCLQHFPRLTAISFHLFKVQNEGVQEFAAAAGSRLESLAIQGSAFNHVYVREETFAKITQQCPNLRIFRYCLLPIPKHCRHEYENLKGSSDGGLVTLVKGCPELRELVMEDDPLLSLDFFLSLDYYTSSSSHHKLKTLTLNRLPCLQNDKARANMILGLLHHQITNLTIDGRPFIHNITPPMEP